MIKKDLTLEIIGLGMILYSDFAVANIKEEEDYFSSNYETIEQVIPHIYKGDIVGFCTGTPGTFHIKFREGYPLEKFEFVTRLGIEVRDERIWIRDLYDLMEWTKECPKEQCLEIENGFYHITVCTNRPASGILGDEQDMYIFLNQLKEMPRLKYKGVPMVCP